MANKLFLQIIAERMYALTKSEQKIATFARELNSIRQGVLLLSALEIA